MIDPGTLKWMLEQTDEKLVDVLFSAGRIPYAEKEYWLMLMPLLRAARPEAQALVAKIMRLPRYDCQGPDGDYDAGMEPGYGYVDYYELEKLLLPYMNSGGDK